jgi:hypothetical protein
MHSPCYSRVIDCIETENSDHLIPFRPFVRIEAELIAERPSEVVDAFGKFYCTVGLAGQSACEWRS